MNRRSELGIFGILLLAALSGCAPLGVSPAPTLHYQCDGNREFILAVAASSNVATIEISGMSFELLAETATEPGEHYACSMLTLWRDGNRARVEMEGSPHFTNCRLKP